MEKSSEKKCREKNFQVWKVDLDFIESQDDITIWVSDSVIAGRHAHRYST